ncbi:MAG: beta-lactamase family protein [Hyphomonadaceae bacterium]|nr:beta-lactamase family protein [Hyphomonadaceae bacterium]MBC6411574.1 beta-lactamase family protein [Hyphomonadaceae bacterium]
MSGTAPFDLYVAPGFEPVSDRFVENFTEHDELAAAFCVYDRDDCIIDLIGGWADKAKTQNFGQNNLVPVFSSGKTMAALVIAWLADQDRLGYDQEIRSIWPEFDTHGKGRLTVAQIMSHQSGLTGVTDPAWNVNDWYDWNKTCTTLAAQEPLWEPGTASGYAPVVYGFLAGEVARRADMHNRTLGQILREELCETEGLDIWIGLPEIHHERCAYMCKPPAPAEFGEINEATRVAFLEKGSSPGGRDITEWRKAEFAGSNCHATAKSLARIQQVALHERLDARPCLSEGTLAQLHKTRISGRNLVLPFDLTFAVGYMKNTPNLFFGPNADTLGHSGWGGSCVFADPKTGLSGAYVMTKQNNTLLGDVRPVELIKSLYTCV